MGPKIYDTSKIVQIEQFSFWNDLICDVFTELACTKYDKNYNNQYNGLLTCFDLDQIEISVVECEASKVYHSKSHVSKTTDEVFLLHIQLEGQSQNSIWGRESILDNGDFTLCKSSLPYELTFNCTNRMMVIKIPRSILQKYIPNPDHIIGLKVDRDNGFTQLLTNYLKGLWLQKDRINEIEHKLTISNAALSLLSTTYSLAFPSFVTPQQNSVRNSHMIRIKTFIAKNLSKPDLSTQDIATAHNISSRYLSMLFSDTGITCSQYILNERLKAVATDLKNTNNHKMKINELAYKWGFNNQSHFSKAFKIYSGLSPKSFRQSLLKD